MFSAICNMCNALPMQNDLLQLFPSQKLEIENHKLCATVKTNYGASCNLTSAPRQPWRQSTHVMLSEIMDPPIFPAPGVPPRLSRVRNQFSLICTQPAPAEAHSPQQNYLSFYFAKMVLLGFRFNLILRLVRNQLDVSRSKFY